MENSISGIGIIMVDIIIDTREKADMKEYFVSSFIKDGINPKLEVLHAGDFLIYGKTEEDAVLIERKEASDFISSLKEGRLWEQMKKMKASGIDDRRVIIEGDPMKAKALRYGRKTTPAHIFGAYEGIFGWGAKIVWTADKYETSAYLRNLCHKKQKPKKYFALRASPKVEMTLREKKLYWIQGLPGLGGKSSRIILSTYPTLNDFINDIENIDKLDGIGKKTKKDILEVLN